MNSILSFSGARMDMTLFSSCPFMVDSKTVSALRNKKYLSPYCPCSLRGKALDSRYIRVGEVWARNAFAWQRYTWLPVCKLWKSYTSGPPVPTGTNVNEICPGTGKIFFPRVVTFFGYNIYLAALLELVLLTIFRLACIIRTSEYLWFPNSVA